jgi:hypothetical protein
LKSRLFFRTKEKAEAEEEENKKDNPKEIFYEFFKLFRKQKKKEKDFSSSDFFEIGGGKIFFLEKWLFKKVLHTHTN